MPTTRKKSSPPKTSPSKTTTGSGSASKSRSTISPSSKSSGAKPKTKLSEHQKELARKRDAKRYAKDKPKRIAAEKAYQEKEKAAHPEIFKARAKHNNEVRDGKTPPHPGKDFHHTSYDPKAPKGKPEPRHKHRTRPNPKTPRTK